MTPDNADYIVEGASPESVVTFLERRGIDASHEIINATRFRITATNVPKARLRDALTTRKGLKLIEDISE